MKQGWQIFSVCAAVCAGIMYAACSTPQERVLPELEEAGNVDKGLVTNEPCAPPCWQRINPGDSKADALNILKGLSVIDTTTIVERPDGVYWLGGRMTFDQNDKVESIGYDLGYHLTLQDLIALKGEPDGFTWPRHPEQEERILNLYWPEQGLWVSVPSAVDFRDATKVAPLSPESLVTGVSYIVPLPDAEAYFLKFVGPLDYPDRPILESYGYYQWEGYEPLPHR